MMDLYHTQRNLEMVEGALEAAEVLLDLCRRVGDDEGVKILRENRRSLRRMQKRMRERIRCAHADGENSATSPSR